MNKPMHPGKRIVALALSLVCLLCLAQPVAAVKSADTQAQIAPVSKETTYTTGVHQYASYGSTIVGRMEDGKEISVLGSLNGFYKVDLYDMVGYIAASQVQQDENGKYFICCQKDSSETQVLEYESATDAFNLRHSIMALADTHDGTPYLYGGTRPGGFDCSGFMYYLYGEHGISLNRGATGQLRNGIVVSKENMMVGDLVFFHEDWDSYAASHVGLYVGNNTIIHSGSKGICYANLDVDWFAETFLCARRIINTTAVEIPVLQAPTASADSCVVLSLSGRTAH